jgi:hypothetical protein
MTPLSKSWCRHEPWTMVAAVTTNFSIPTPCGMIVTEPGAFCLWSNLCELDWHLRSWFLALRVVDPGLTSQFRLVPMGFWSNKFIYLEYTCFIFNFVFEVIIKVKTRRHLLTIPIHFHRNHIHTTKCMLAHGPTSIHHLLLATWVMIESSGK